MSSVIPEIFCVCLYTLQTLLILIYCSSFQLIIALEAILVLVCIHFCLPAGDVNKAIEAADVKAKPVLRAIKGAVLFIVICEHVQLMNKLEVELNPNY